MIIEMSAYVLRDYVKTRELQCRCEFRWKLHYRFIR